MATKIFGILTAVVLALAGYVAHINQGKYAEEIENTKTEKDKLATSQARFEKARVKLADTIAERTGVDGENENLVVNESQQKKANEDLKSQVETKTSKTTLNKQNLDEIREKTARVGDIRELASKMSVLRSEIEELTQSIDTNESTLSQLTSQNTQAENQITALKKKLEIMSSGQSLPTLKTRIRSIYPAWGFVTLAHGNNAGVVANSTLDVVRDGQTIARLLVSGVETSSASASIVPDSIAADVTLMIGDQVVASTTGEKLPSMSEPQPQPQVFNN